ncbi:hypothetical protein [Kitasatospora sp. NPDC056184]|uniref:hypothetical protein n=1 Tax=Kitasatospora sp. NPDC056184 TaxID=3345738 RepID=UPI0035D5B479
MTDTQSPTGPAERNQPWWLQAVPGCCTTCPVRTNCRLYDANATACALTGHLPPPPPPAHPAGQIPGAEHALSDTVTALLQPGWSDVAEQVIARTDTTGTSDLARLQIGRNLTCLALVTLVSVGGTTAAGWVAHAITTGGITAPVLGPAGAVLCVTGSLWLARHVPGPLGAVSAIAWSVLSATGTGLWRLARSPYGWILTRPLIWAAACGVLTVFWRVIVHTLTGADL